MPILFAVLKVSITSSGSPMAGQNFTLTCSLTGEISLLSNISYQWRRGESLLTNSPILHFDSLYLSDAGQYSCVVILHSQPNQENTIIETYNIEFTSETFFHCYFVCYSLSADCIIFACISVHCNIIMVTVPSTLYSTALTWRRKLFCVYSVRKEHNC